MVICPVCQTKVYTRQGKVVPHGSNESLCYGSYMAAGDCRYAGPSSYVGRGLVWFIRKLIDAIGRS